MSKPDFIPRRIKSFVRRDGRMTEAQRRVLEELWPEFGLSLGSKLDFNEVFGRDAPCILEIGFGSGRSLLEIAKAHPEKDFIGIEMYQPGVGSLLLGIEETQIQNLRVFYADAVEDLSNA
jgi:tRNA (guanine-N7-)-methyltransferase